MASIVDDRGFNQGFKPSTTVEVRTKRRCMLIAGEMQSERNNEVLEIGCGLGDLSLFLAQRPNNNVLATDLCEPFIEEARNKFESRNLHFMQLDFNNPEKIDGRKFDYVVGNGILHHLYYTLDQSLKNLRNLLRDHGKIIFLEPNLLNPYCFAIFNTIPLFRRIARLEPTEMAFTKTFIHRKLEAAGFDHIEIDYRDFLTPITPRAFIRPTIRLGEILEKMPVLKLVSQSLFIRAERR